MPDGSMQQSAETPALFDRLPPEILGSLTARQRSAIASAAGTPGWQPHPVNIRLSLPFVPHRYYLTIVGGPERRASGRRKIDRVRNPLRTAGNVAFVFCAAVAVYAVVIATVLISSSVVQF